MTYRLCANVSILLPDRPLLERFAVAAELGFDAVEMWWPFADAVPSDSELEELLAAIDSAGVQLVALNLFGGDLSAGMRGIVSHPGREAEVAANVRVIVEIARRTGCVRFNALYGNRLRGVDPAAQDAVAIANLTAAVEAVAAVGGTILIEPISGVPDYPLRTAADAVRVVEQVSSRVERGSVGLLLDTFHLTANGDDLAEVIASHGAQISHVQFADAPGRGEPGTGGIDFARVCDALASIGYDGPVACEYAPTTTAAASLGWIDSLPQVALTN